MKFISGERYLIDTNVLVYSVNKESPFYTPSRHAIESGLQQEARLVVAHQNLIEFIAVLTRGYKIGLRDVLRDVEAFSSRFEVIFPFHTTFQTYISIARKLGRKVYPFDLYLVSTMRDNEVSRIITGNAKDFQGAGLHQVIELDKEALK